ncbi:hypothetical protein HG536_0A05850 [Torulaspora globosa]|uniref:U3 small nucleolar RNA-associated protein 6 N-terminal domain-containing protein n=1 Tax=Torulaspora globosa TaxID=48254 RepID=A0A7G3ZB84_9SACH|nr:uncharacterized protein HG536_0A05850 [Torulaspora globosa]QLL30770.1 hypothetical protein HG536_0A05850 [Torulaspora globosa]
MSSKTRYYLEQCIPEVDDLVDKGLFTKREVSAIMSKRTDFEHRLNSRGSSINDYMKYISYEKSVDKLRQKRVKRLLEASKTNSISDWSIQQRIAFIYQRGCKKFPKDLKFWAMYLNYLKTRGNTTSYRKIHNVYNELLKLHPNNVEVWISCAKYEYEVHANFKSCRVVFQNGLAFNPDVPKLWYEYVKFELNFITKLINRRKVMGLINEREQQMDMLKEQEKGRDVNDDGGITAPSTGDAMKDKLNELPEADMNMLGNEETNPALRGDIALTIFDVCMDKLGECYMKKNRGYFAVTDARLSKDLSVETVKYLYDISKDFISLFDQFQDLQREYLINHALAYWKQSHYSISLQDELPELYINMIMNDITLNIRYMSLESLEVDKLQLSVKKYFAYKSKMDGGLAKDLQKTYSEFLRENYTDKVEKDSDPRYNTLMFIIKKL